MSSSSAQNWKVNPKLEGVVGPNGTLLSLCAACNGKHRKHTCGHGKTVKVKAEKKKEPQVPKMEGPRMASGRPVPLSADPKVAARIQERMEIDTLPDPDGPLPHELDEDGRPLNHNFCVSCVGGGDLLCCDGCTASFHYDCLTPPIEVGSYPEDKDFFCAVCIHKQKQGSQAEAGKQSPGSILVAALQNLQPQNFDLPSHVMEEVKGNTKLCRPQFMGDRAHDDNSFDFCGACTVKLPPRMQGRGHCCAVCESTILRYVHIPRSFGTIKEKTPNQIAALQAQREKAKAERQQREQPRKSNKRGRSPTPELSYDPNEVDTTEDDEAELFECESGCGFEHMDKDVVEEHEQECAKLDKGRRDSRKRREKKDGERKDSRRKRTDGVLSDSPELFECESGCGFEHEYKFRVEQHEKHCQKLRTMHGLESKPARVRKPDQRRHKSLTEKVEEKETVPALLIDADSEQRSKRSRQGDRRAPLKAEESIGAVAFEADEVPEYNLELPVAEVFEKQHAQALQDFGQFYKLVSQLPRADGNPQQKFNEETPPNQLVLELMSWQRIMNIWEKTQPICGLIQADSLTTPDEVVNDAS